MDLPGPLDQIVALLPRLCDRNFGLGAVGLETPAGTVVAVLVSVGNPHCVVFDQPVTRERCLELGPHLERHPAFPERTNVQLCQVVDRARVRAEIWERGAGYTLASGTSA